MKDQKMVALLPIKKNSERVPGKNFKNFAGKPLFLWILESLLKIEDIDEIIINTDAKDLLIENNIPNLKKIKIRERADHLIGDDISMNLIIKDDVESTDADLFLMTHVTNPLLRKTSILKAIHSFLNESKYDSLFSANKLQTRFYDYDMNPINHNPSELIKTQDLPIWYEENSCLYVFSKKSFFSSQARIGKNPMIYSFPKTESIDIDDQEDWKIAESIMIDRYK